MPGLGPDPTQNLHGTTAYGQTYGPYPWNTNGGGMQPAQPAVPPGGGPPSAAPAVAPAAGGGAVPRPSNVYLSPQEQQAILKAAGYPGGTIVGGQAIPQPKMGKDITGLRDVAIDIGEYQVSVQDAQGNNVGSITVTKGQPDEQGTPTWGLSDIPKTPTTNKASPTDYVVKTTDQGVWYPDDINNPGGGYHQILPPGVKNEDDEIKKAVDRQVAEGDRNARQRNEATTGIYGTDTEVAQIQNQAATQKLNQAELNEKIRQFNEQRKYADQEEKRAADKAASDLQTAATGREATQASTAGTRATTAATTQTTEQAAQKFPGELKQQAATLEATQASTAQTKQATQIAGAPTLQGGLTNPYLTTVNPLTGAVDQSQMNRAYQPKTQAEIAARVGQIQELMTRKGQEVQGKVGTNGYTAEDALKEFNQWYAQNVTPQQDSLQAAQEEAQFQRGQAQAATRQAAQQTALGAGTQQVSAFNAMVGANPVGPGYAEVMDQVRQGKIPTGEQMKSAFTYQAPNPMDAARQGTMEALKYIDPTAAAATGAPPPNLPGIDIQKAFAPSQYMPGAGGPMAPMPPAPAAPAAPGRITDLGPPVPNPALAPGFQHPWLNPQPAPGFGNPTPQPIYQGGPMLGAFSAGANPWDYAPAYSY